MLYPQNGDHIVTTDYVTSLHPMYHTCFLQSLTSGTFFHNVSTIAAQPVVLWAYFLHWPAITWYQTNIRYPHHPSAVSSFQEIAMRYDHRYNNVQVRWLITNKNVTIVSQADQSCPWVHFVWPNPTHGQLWSRYCRGRGKVYLKRFQVARSGASAVQH